MKVLITGAAGFIGYHLSKKMVEQGHTVVGVDNINDYYEPDLKIARLRQMGIDTTDLNWNIESVSQSSSYRFYRTDLRDKDGLRKVFDLHRFELVIHLAAQAGVRHSLTHPYEYISNNVEAFMNILENSRHKNAGHLIYASSSSVYGLNSNMPFSESDCSVHPVSIYGATKRSNELMAHSYSHLFDLPTTGLRFFTVYGPWGRPDMAIFLFTKSILRGEKIKVFNQGDMVRDFTYIDDIIEGIFSLSEKPPPSNSEWNPSIAEPWHSSAPFRIYNIGRGAPVNLLEFIRTIEEVLGISAKMEMMDMQPGDVVKTMADTSLLEQESGYQPKVHIRNGVSKFVNWYKEYYGY